MITQGVDLRGASSRGDDAALDARLASPTWAPTASALCRGCEQRQASVGSGVGLVLAGVAVLLVSNNTTAVRPCEERPNGRRRAPCASRRCARSSASSSRGWSAPRDWSCGWCRRALACGPAGRLYARKTYEWLALLCQGARLDISLDTYTRSAAARVADVVLAGCLAQLAGLAHGQAGEVAWPLPATLVALLGPDAHPAEARKVGLRLARLVLLKHPGCACLCYYLLLGGLLGPLWLVVVERARGLAYWTALGGAPTRHWRHARSTR